MLIKVNGVALPTPSEFQVGIMDISKAERNAKGTMIMERITTKRKLELSWKVLSSEKLSSILNSVSSVFFSVEYIDPQTNKTRSGAFYSGDRTCPMMSFWNEIPIYKDVKINLVER